MPGPTFPTPLPPWLKGAIFLSQFAYPAGEALYDYLQPRADADDLEWRRIVATGDRSTPAGTSEDRAQISFDFVNMTDGQLDTTWTNGDYDTCAGHVGNMLGAITGYQSDNFTWRQARVYQMKFNASGGGFADSGDPIKIYPYSAQGSGSSTQELPYQVALSVTERTVQRKSWGRFYLPCPAMSLLDQYGRWTSSTCTAVADIVGDMYVAESGSGFLPVVASPTTRTLFTVTQVQVDDIPDVQRRRRARQTLIRAVAPTI